MLNPIQVQPKTENKDPSKLELGSDIQVSPLNNETPEYQWEEDALLYISKSIQKTGERKVDSKLLEDFKSLEKLELSEKKRKVEELQKELNTIKTQTPKLFKDLSDEIEKLITQIEKETNTVTALRKHHAKISEIITKIEDPTIYRSFEEKREQDPEIYKSFLKDPIKAIITKILADDQKNDQKIDEEFKKLFEADPDSITKIITPIVKENAIKEITNQIKKENAIKKKINEIFRNNPNNITTLTKHLTAISEIITKIENPEDPIEAIINGLATNPEIDEEFKKLLEEDPDSITKIITPIVKENAIKEIKDEIKSDASEDLQTEENKFDSLKEIIDKILEKDSLISKYYKKDTYSILEIIDQLQSKKTDEKIDEDPITKITTRILDENAKASQAIKEDPLGQIIIEHQKETSEKISSKIEQVNLSKKAEEDRKAREVEEAERDKRAREIREAELEATLEKFKIDTNFESRIGRVVHKIDLDLSQENVDKAIFGKQESQTQKPSFISRFSFGPQYKQKKNIEISSDSGNKADFVFVQLDEKSAPPTEVEKLDPPAEVEKLDPPAEDKKLIFPTEQEITESIIQKQNIKFLKLIKGLAKEQAKEELPEKQAEEELHEKDEKARSFDVTRLLIYAKLIDKIPQEYSDSISSIHQEIINLKKQERDHKKTLVFLTPIITREEEEERERKRIAEEEKQIRIFEEELTAVEEKLKVVQVKIKENEEEKKLALKEEKLRRLALPSVVKSIEEPKALKEKIREAQEKLETNSEIRKKIEEKIKEILSPEYVDKKLTNGPKESIMDQLIIEAIIVDEAKKLLGPDKIQEIEIKISQQSPENIPSEAFNLLVLKKALEIKFQQSDETIDVAEIYTQQNIDNFFSFENKLSKHRDEISTLEVESNTIKDQIYNLDIELTKKNLALMQGLALQEGNQAVWVSAQLISASLPAEYHKQSANLEELGRNETVSTAEERTQDYSLSSQGDQSPRSFDTGFIFTQTDLESESHNYQTTTTLDAGSSVGTFSSDLLLGDVVNQNNLSQFSAFESPCQGTGNNGEYTNSSSLTYDPYSGVLSTVCPCPLASPPPPSIGDQASSILTTLTAIDFLRKILAESEVTREVDPNYSSQISQSFSGSNNLNPDSSQHGVSEDQLSNSQQHLDPQITGQDLTTTSFYNQAPEDNGKKEIEEEKIKKSFSNLFLRCLIEKIESITVKKHSDRNSQISHLETESIAQIEDKTSSTESLESTVLEEINLNQKDIIECKEKISDHLAFEYQKLLEKLEPTKKTKKIEGLQDDWEDGTQQNQDEKFDKPQIQETIEDPKIYCGVGIRMALEKETIDDREQHYLKIVEIFQDSALTNEKHLNQKITGVEIKENGEIKFKSITDILTDCGGDTNKFYAKISTIFHNPLEEKISLKFKADSSTNQAENQTSLDGTFTKKLFLPNESASIKMTNINDIKNLTDSLNSTRSNSERLLNTTSQTSRQ